MTDHPTNQPEAVERLAEVIAAAFGPDFVTNYTDKKVARAVLAAGYRPPAPDAAQADECTCQRMLLTQAAYDRLMEAVKDVCWRAVQYGETDDGDTAYYLVTKGAMHRLIAQAPGAAFRADSRETLPDLDAAQAVVERVEGDEDDPHWSWTVTGTEFTHGTIERPFEDAGVVQADSGPDALMWLLNRGPVWDVLDLDQSFTVTIAPAALRAALGEFSQNSPESEDSPSQSDESSNLADQRVRDAEAEALEKAAGALNYEALNWQPGGWGSNESDQGKLWALQKTMTWLRARAAGVRGGASTVRRFIDQLPNDRFTERETERLREWADEVGA